MANEKISSLPATGPIVGGELVEVSQPTGGTPPYVSTKLPLSAIGGSKLAMLGLDGEPGEDGGLGPPGNPGQTGTTGAAGPAGPATFLDAEVVDPEIFMVPGSPGTPGAIGAAGLPGAFVAIDGDQGEEGMPIPGPLGPAGPTGPQGVPGPMVVMDADQGEEGMPIPGGQGSPGAQGTQGVPGVATYLEAEVTEPDVFPVPGAPGAAGLTGASGPMGPAIFLEAEPGDEGMMGPPGAAGAAGSTGTSPTTGVPATIADLLFWWKADSMTATTGNKVYGLQNYSGAFAGIFNGTGGNATFQNSALNSLPSITFPGNSGGDYTISNSGFNLSQGTYFAVIKPTSFSQPGDMFCGPIGALEFRVESSSGNLTVLKAYVAGIGTSSTGLTVSTWAQVNVTYNSSTGAWAIRSARTANGSGTNVQSITGNTSAIGWNPSASGNEFTGQIAELIAYNRVLTNTEITTVETYLNTKWGV